MSQQVRVMRVSRVSNLFVFNCNFIRKDETFFFFFFFYRETTTNASFSPLFSSIQFAEHVSASCQPPGLSSVFAREIPKLPIIKREPMLLIFRRALARWKLPGRTREVKSVTCFASTMASREWDLKYSQAERANTCLSASCSASFSFRYLFTS